MTVERMLNYNTGEQLNNHSIETERKMSRSEFVCNCNIVHHDVVDRIKKEMLSGAEYESLSAFFRVFGDETRIRILWALDQHEMCVCDLCNVLEMTKSAVSHQLSSLRKVHLVRFRKDGKSVYYSLDDEHIRKIFETGLEHVRHSEGYRKPVQKIKMQEEAK